MRARVPFCLRPALKILAAGAGLWLAAQNVTAQNVVWSGADVASHNTNWSDANNWTGGTPGPATNIFFFDTGASGTRGAANNIVNGNTTISSLDYGNTNGFHTTQINTGVTLTVTNGAAITLVMAGTGTDNGANQTSYSTITGPGALAVLGANFGSAFSVQQCSATAGSHMATLDMSGLADFNLVAGRLLVGGNGGSAGNVNRPSGTLYFATNSSVDVYGSSPAVDVGDGSTDGGTNQVYLGQSTAIFADSMTIARQKSTATMSFNPAFGSSST